MAINPKLTGMMVGITTDDPIGIKLMISYRSSLLREGKIKHVSEFMGYTYDNGRIYKDGEVVHEIVESFRHHPSFKKYFKTTETPNEVPVEEPVENTDTVKNDTVTEVAKTKNYEKECFYLGFASGVEDVILTNVAKKIFAEYVQWYHEKEYVGYIGIFDMYNDIHKYSGNTEQIIRIFHEIEPVIRNNVINTIKQLILSKVNSPNLTCKSVINNTRNGATHLVEEKRRPDGSLSHDTCVDDLGDICKYLYNLFTSVSREVFRTLENADIYRNTHVSLNIGKYLFRVRLNDFYINTSRLIEKLEPEISEITNSLEMSLKYMSAYVCTDDVIYKDYTKEDDFRYNDYISFVVK